jgi:hypothetical protein
MLLMGAMKSEKKGSILSQKRFFTYMREDALYRILSLPKGKPLLEFHIKKIK